MQSYRHSEHAVMQHCSALGEDHADGANNEAYKSQEIYL